MSTQESRDQWVSDFIERIRPSGYSTLESISSWPAEEGLAALGKILEFACCAQHIGSIMAGRRALARIPSDWLGQALDSAVSRVLNLADDDYEYRRLVEALECHPVEREKFLQLGLKSAVPDIAEAALDYLS